MGGRARRHVSRRGIALPVPPERPLALRRPHRPAGSARVARVRRGGERATAARHRCAGPPPARPGAAREDPREPGPDLRRPPDRRRRSRLGARGGGGRGRVLRGARPPRRRGDRSHADPLARRGRELPRRARALRARRPGAAPAAARRCPDRDRRLARRRPPRRPPRRRLSACGTRSNDFARGRRADASRRLPGRPIRPSGPRRTRSRTTRGSGGAWRSRVRSCGGGRAPARRPHTCRAAPGASRRGARSRGPTRRRRGA